MVLNNRATDRQPHPHSLRLGGVESIEDPSHALRVQANARVLHCNTHLIDLTALRSDDQLSRSVSNRAHGFDRIHDQIKHTCSSSTRSPSMGGRSPVSSVRSATSFLRTSSSASATTSRTAWFMSSNSFSVP